MKQRWGVDQRKDDPFPVKLDFSSHVNVSLPQRVKAKLVEQGKAQQAPVPTCGPLAPPFLFFSSQIKKSLKKDGVLSF